MPELPPIVTKAYAFALWRLPRVQDFPRSSRFVLDNRLIATLGFFIYSFSAVLASDFAGPVAPSSTATPSKSCTNTLQTHPH